MVLEQPEVEMVEVAQEEVAQEEVGLVVGLEEDLVEEGMVAALGAGMAA